MVDVEGRVDERFYQGNESFVQCRAATSKSTNSGFSGERREFFFFHKLKLNPPCSHMRGSTPLQVSREAALPPMDVSSAGDRK